MFWVQSRSTSQGLPYDFSSIMHVRHNAFSQHSSESTIVPFNRTIPKTVLGNSTMATDLDFLHLNLLYCGGTDARFMKCIFGDYTVYILIISDFLNFIQSI